MKRDTKLRMIVAIPPMPSRQTLFWTAAFLTLVSPWYLPGPAAWFAGQVGGFFHLAFEAARDTAWGFHPVRFAETYLSGSRIPRLLVGLSALLASLATILIVPHVLINFRDLVRDLRSLGGWSWANFVRRQDECEERYLQLLSSAEAELLQQAREFSLSETEEVKAVLAQVEAQDSSALLRWIHSFSRAPGARVTTGRQAVAHILFSFESMTRSVRVYSRVWNHWFAFRSFFPLFHPFVSLTVACFPGFYAVSLSRFGVRTLPSRWNGGLRGLWRLVAIRLQGGDLRQRLKRFENAILDSEALLRASVDQLGDGAPQSVRDAGFDLAMQLWWIQAGADAQRIRPAFGLTLEDRMKLSLPHGPPKALSEPEAFTLAADAWSRVLQAPVAKRLFLDSWRSRWLHSMAAALDPSRSRQLEIVQYTEQKLEDPKAVARAVRSMIASNLVDKPLELIFILFCFAGIQQSFLMPLQEQMFGPNSWFYLSRYVFLNGFLYSVIAGVFSDTWLKIQQDTMNDGKFDHAPSGKDAKRSFASWHYFQTFTNPENSWWRNQKYTVQQYILPTFKATFATSLMVNLITLGRFDLDAFLAHFLVLALFPFTGLSWKFEQGFELASAWTVRNIPDRLRPHPLVQAYSQRAMASRRVVFNLYYRVWENITWNFLAAFMNMTTLAYGTRSFSRLLFQGYTPVELIANTIRTVQTGVSLPAAASWALIQLDSLLTRNYTDGTKLRDGGWTE